LNDVKRWATETFQAVSSVEERACGEVDQNQGQNAREPDDRSVREIETDLRWTGTKRLFAGKDFFRRIVRRV
jgi:hypothetical protein